MIVDIIKIQNQIDDLIKTFSQQEVHLLLLIAQFENYEESKWFNDEIQLWQALSDFLDKTHNALNTFTYDNQFTP